LSTATNREIGKKIFLWGRERKKKNRVKGKRVKQL
jgi:hypothetical protein